MNTENAALYTIHESSTKFGLIHLRHSLRGAVVTIFISEESIIRMKAHFTQKNRKVGEPEHLFRKVSHIHQFGTSLRCTLAEHNSTLRIGYTRRCQQDIRWPHALIFHLHLVVENGVHEHDLELASCEIPSRTGMTPVSQRQELRRGGNHITFITILLEPHFREAEAFKLFRGFSYVSGS